MRYFYGAAVMAFVLMIAAATGSACEIREEIRSEISDLIRARIADLHIDMDVDFKKLEDQIHKQVHASIDREKRRLERERERLERERRSIVRHDRDPDDGGWSDSMWLALGLYGIGIGALILLGRRPRRENTE